MGLSSSKTKSTYTPSAQQLGAANTLTSAYQQAQPGTQAFADTLTSQIPAFAGTLPGLASGIEGASKYYNDVVGGQYLGQGNPYLDKQIATTNASLMDRVNGAFSAAGRTGSGANTYALTKALGENENSLRYGDYSAERDRMAQAAAGAGGLASQGLGATLQLGGAATGMTLEQALRYAGGIGSLGIGGTTTQTSSPSLGAILGQIAGNAASAARMGG